MEPEQLTFNFENNNTAVVWITPNANFSENCTYAVSGYTVKYSDYRYKCDKELDAIWFGAAPSQPDQPAAVVDYLAITRAVAGE